MSKQDSDTDDSTQSSQSSKDIKPDEADLLEEVNSYEIDNEFQADVKVKTEPNSKRRKRKKPDLTLRRALDRKRNYLRRRRMDPELREKERKRDTERQRERRRAMDPEARREARKRDTERQREKRALARMLKEGENGGKTEETKKKEKKLTLDDKINLIREKLGKPALEFQ